MSNLLNDLVEAVDGEKILAVQLFNNPRYEYSGVDPAAAILGKVLTFEEIWPHLNYEYDAGYGTQDCHDFFAWTATRVFFVHEYDGSTWVRNAPRFYEFP